MFWLLCPSLSHASYGIVCISTYLYEAFPTKVVPELSVLGRCRAVQWQGSFLFCLWLASEQCLSTEDLSARWQKAASNIWGNCRYMSRIAKVKILMKYTDPVFQCLASPTFFFLSLSSPLPPTFILFYFQEYSVITLATSTGEHGRTLSFDLLRKAKDLFNPKVCKKWVI